MKVLIYGFGYLGRAALELCEVMGCEIAICDDFLDLSHQIEGFLRVDELVGQRFDLCLVCIEDQALALEMKQKLSRYQDEAIIRFFCILPYRKKYARLAWERYKDARGFVSFLLRDSMWLDGFAQLWQEDINQYLQTKKANVERAFGARLEADEKFLGMNAFAKMHQMASCNLDTPFVLFPGFYTYPAKLEDSNFFFREKIDFVGLKNRDAKSKLIALFGPSTVRGDDVELAHTLSQTLARLLESSAGGGAISCY